MKLGTDGDTRSSVKMDARALCKKNCKRCKRWIKLETNESTGCFKKMVNYK